MRTVASNARRRPWRRSTGRRTGPARAPGAWRAVVAAVSLAVTAALTPAAFGPAPPALAAQEGGWELAFSDDFDGGSLDRSDWATYGSTYGDENGVSWREDEVSVSDGKLRIRLQRRSDRGKPFTSGGVVNIGPALTYGRYEFRARVPEGKGIDSYATLWPENDDDINATLLEMLAPGPDSASISNGYGSGRNGTTVTGDFAGAFHTFAIEWSPERISVLFDGETWFTSTRVPTVPRSLGFAMSCGDNLTGSPDASTPLPAFFEIDWVRVYRYDPDAAPTTTEPEPTTTTAPKPLLKSVKDAPTTTAAPTTAAPAGGAAPRTDLALDGDQVAARRAGSGRSPLLGPVLIALAAVAGLLAWRRFRTPRGRHTAG